MKRLLSILLLITCQSAFSQDAAMPRPSPMSVALAKYKDAYIKIVYSQPGKNGREIFGKLVPLGEVWRTGANEATEMTCTRDIKIGGVDLKAGTYSIFTIPGNTTWSFIINADLGLMGAYNYNPKMDVLRFEVPVTPLSDVVYEAFTITLDQKNEKVDLSLIWDKTKVTIPIQFLEPKL